MRKNWYCGLVLGICVAGVPAAAKDYKLPVDSQFHEDWVEWDGGLGKAYLFRWDARLIDGEVALCGAGQFLDATTRSATIDLLRKARVLLDGKVILKDLTYFAKYPKSQDLGKVEATCRSTGAKPAGKTGSVEIDISGRARF
ncbi:MAG TPA: hypothetical protein PK450_06940 [Paracoccaceae bacterium]|nr:hypothetical protein [Paracoccaceae bacterium]